MRYFQNMLIGGLLRQPIISSFIRFLRNLGFEFMDKGCQKSAAALTYMTLFALVPLLTVTYFLLSMVPTFEGSADKLHTLIFSSFVPEAGAEVQEYLSRFSSQARNLTGFGVAMLVVTAYLMLTNIEKTFNAIWGVREARRGLSSFLLYWAVLSIGPLLLGAGLVISTYLLSLKILFKELDQLGMLAMLFQVAPLFMTTIAFTLLFAAVPNCRVPIKFAFVGGIFTAISFELLKRAFGYLVARSSLELIYGAFAVVPLFLMWINVFWILALTGAVLVRNMAEHQYSAKDSRLTSMLAVLSCLAVFADKSRTGAVASDRDFVTAGVGLVQWQGLRSLLVSRQWVVVTDGGDYVLTRNLTQCTLWDVAELVSMPVTEYALLKDYFLFVDKNERGEAIENHWKEDMFSRNLSIYEHTKEQLNVPLENFFNNGK